MGNVAACGSDRQESGCGKPVIHSGGHRGSGLGLGQQRPPDRRRTTMTTDDMMTLRAL